MSFDPKRVSPKIRKLSRELRTSQTPAETKLWSVLRNRNLEGYKFRRQHPIGNFVVDFFCVQKKLVIEIDGDSHATRENYDAMRTEWLEGQGCKVIRFTNEDVLKRMDAVAREIVRVCADLEDVDL